MYLTLDSRFQNQTLFYSVAETLWIPQNPSEVLFNFMIVFTDLFFHFSRLSVSFSEIGSPFLEIFPGGTGFLIEEFVKDLSLKNCDNAETSSFNLPELRWKHQKSIGVVEYYSSLPGG